jgi:hypothetical protein
MDELTRLIPKLAKDTRDAEIRASKSKAELEKNKTTYIRNEEEN